MSEVADESREVLKVLDDIEGTLAQALRELEESWPEVVPSLAAEVAVAVVERARVNIDELRRVLI